jgi:hypothetical protein
VLVVVSISQLRDGRMTLMGGCSGIVVEVDSSINMAGGGGPAGGGGGGGDCRSIRIVDERPVKLTVKLIVKELVLHEEESVGIVVTVVGTASTTIKGMDAGSL